MNGYCGLCYQYWWKETNKERSPSFPAMITSNLPLADNNLSAEAYN